MNQWNYEHQINNSYIIFKPGDIIEEHALKMMRYHKIPHLLTMKEKTIKGCVHLYYDITNLENLFEYTKIHGLEYDLLRELVDNLFEILDFVEEFFLSEECFLLNSKTLFFDTNSNYIYFLYLPFSTRPYNFYEQLQILLTQLLQVVHKQDEKAISLVYKLRIMIEEQNFGINAFKDIMDYEDEIKNISTIPLKEETSIKEAVLENKQNFCCDKKKSKIIITFILSQIMMLAIIFISCNNLVVPETNTKLMWTKLILLLIVAGVLEVIIVSRILIQRSGGKSIIKQFFKSIQKSIRSKKEIKEDASATKWNWSAGNFENNTKQIGSNDRAYLVGEDQIKIPIIKSTFIIGKANGAVDLCIQDELVSRHHCKINKLENKYYLIDLDSCNGTYINDISLNSQKKYLLKNGDCIKIGFSTYIFAVI